MEEQQAPLRSRYDLASICQAVDASLDPARVLHLTGANGLADLVAKIESAADLDVLVGTGPGFVTPAVRDRAWAAISTMKRGGDGKGQQRKAARGYWGADPRHPTAAALGTERVTHAMRHFRGARTRHLNDYYSVQQVVVLSLRHFTGATGGHQAGELQRLGFSAQRLRKLGYTAAMLLALGYSTADIRKAGYSASQMPFVPCLTMHVDSVEADGQVAVCCTDISGAEVSTVRTRLHASVQDVHDAIETEVGGCLLLLADGRLLTRQDAALPIEQFGDGAAAPQLL